MAKKRSRSRVKLTPLQKEQNAQMKEIRNLVKNIGFARMPRIDGTEFVYESRTSELDDIFYYENIIVLAEYTVTNDIGKHLLNKKITYDNINKKPSDFIKFLVENSKFKEFKKVFDDQIGQKYSFNQLQIRILYASKNTISEEHKAQVKDILYFDLPVVKYFESIAKVIKKTTKHEFLDFLKIEFSKVGENIKSCSVGATDEFLGHILPEEHSSFKEGYKLVSFYIDADSLMKRAYVLRNDGWRNMNNIGLYQRMITGKKINSMRRYLNEEKRVFINNIIVTLPTHKVKLLDKNEVELQIDDKGNFINSDETKVQPAIIKIANEANIIGIIDGQHRAYAYHEGDDIHEKVISRLRHIQNLLVTGILYPQNEPDQKRLKFEAKLFLEINSNQTGASSQLKQEIEFIMNPFSTISVAKNIINKLNESGPLSNLFEEHFYEKSKIKTSTIISFGLKPLVKYEETDSLYKIWQNPNKKNLKDKVEDYTLLNEYKDFCATEIRNLFIGFKANVNGDTWKVDRTDANAILNVTIVNGMINCLRNLIKNNKTGDVDYYKSKFSSVKGFAFKSYKSSQYSRMGRDLYDKFFI
jgi:DGQHR domain-containing protein